MSYAISEPSGDPRDLGDQAAERAAVDREIAARRRLAAMEILDPRQIDADGVVHCLDCSGPIEPERLLALAPRGRDGQPDVSRSHAARCIGCQAELEHWRRLARGGR